MPIQRMLLITYILFSIISMLLMAGIAYSSSRAALQDEIRENLQAQAVTIMQQVDAIMFERVENIYGWSRLELMQDVKVGDIDKRLTRFLSNLNISYAGLYDELFVAYQGKLVSSSNAAMIGHQWAATSPWISLPIQQASVEISKPDRQSTNASMLLGIRLNDAFSEAELGMLYARFDWMDISRILDKAVGDTNRQAILIDEKGEILSSSSNYAKNVDESFLMQLDDKIPSNASFGTFTQKDQSQSANTELVGFDSSEGIRGLPALGWHVLIITPSSIAFAQVTQLLWTFIILLAVITLLAVLFARRIAKIIAAPIQHLTHVTRKIPTQLEDVDIVVQGQGEVAELAQAFKNMLQELARSREHLVRMSKLAAVGEMSAMLAHEVRNPLGILRSSAQLLERQPGLDERGRTMVAYMITECDRIDNLVSSLLESARPRQPIFSKNDLNKIISKVAELAKSKADKKGISIKFSAEEKVTMIECDHEQMTQVILNLLLNAVQILPVDHGTIDIDTNTVENRLIIRIFDNGPGIAVAEREKIFDLFVSSRDGGMGLGLAVVKEIIQMHQGTVIVEDSPSGGAQFCITLPLYRNRIN